MTGFGKEFGQYAIADPDSLDATESAPKRQQPFPTEPSGREWNEGEVDALYPRLCEKPA